MVATQTGEKHTVLFCNYCESGMSVPVDQIPDDPKCNSCKELENRDDNTAKSLRIIRESGVEVGDIVEYQGEEWGVDSTGPWHTVHLQNKTGVRMDGVDVRDLDVVEKDAWAHPDRVVDGCFWFEVEPDIRSGAD
ncbi:hypothetical protein HLRTI_001322 [Halorhabdus tiamatea SARL4B]|uniref:Uncharacterized protein n=1 Tax=Halorhabdus tiamatea SARL4B TaxID=1033806 RepID=U2E3U6_9EURY|nr:hypothetical protein [Halorhabdus tiamatea]ERJ06616.1 hypothetical protein HLRTI_001322 [Halorhabdus tiamatea SARL4B]